MWPLCMARNGGPSPVGLGRQLAPNTSVKAKGREELAAQKKAPHNEKMFDDAHRDVATEHDSIEQLQRLKANLMAALWDKGAELASLKDKGRESKSLRRRKRRSTMKSCAAIASTTPGSRNPRRDWQGLPTKYRMSPLHLDLYDGALTPLVQSRSSSSRQSWCSSTIGSILWIPFLVGFRTP